MSAASLRAGKSLNSLTSIQWPWTHECQSKQPKKAGWRARGPFTSTLSFMTWSSLFGYSRRTHLRARLAKWDACSGVRAIPSINSEVRRGTVEQVLNKESGEPKDDWRETAR